jgi:E3 ubiquitin-protein ligase synoviolin
MLTAGLLFTLNTALLVNVAWQAYTQADRHFFPFTIALLSSTKSITLLTSFSLFTLYFVTHLLRKLFFGELRLIEEEQIKEYGWMTASESLLAMTVFRNQFDAGFVLLFAGVLAIKSMHWVGKARQEMMEQSVALPDTYHTRMASCLLFLLIVDVLGILFSANSLIDHGPSMALLLVSDFTILLLSTVSMCIKYGLALYEMYQRADNEAFEISFLYFDRSTLLYYFDVVIDLCKLSVYLIFFLAIILVYGLPLHLFRELYLTVANFVKRCQDVIKYRQATENMNARYPDASQADLDRVHSLCVICRDDLKLVGNGGFLVMARKAKVLPCGHSFHFKCLRSWLERQQACPTCRASVISVPKKSSTGSGSGSRAPPTIPFSTRSRSTTNEIEGINESLESLKRQMVDLQKNMSDTAEIIRSISASIRSPSTSTSLAPSPSRLSRSASVGVGIGSSSSGVGQAGNKRSGSPASDQASDQTLDN